MKKLILHIGYPKTATTSLQELLFKNINEVYYLNEIPSINALNHSLFYHRENTLKRNIHFFSNFFDDNCSKEYETFLYSNESILSLSMFFRFQPSPYIWTQDPNSVGRKLLTVFKESEYFDEIKIFLVLRRQDQILKSMYAQVYNRYFSKFEETKTFEKFLSYSNSPQSGGFINDALYYNDVVEQYEELFGKENIIISVFDDLKHNKSKFFSKICNELDLSTIEAEKFMDSRKLNQKSSKKGKYKTDEITLATKLHAIKNKLLKNKSTGLTSSPVYKYLTKLKVKGQSIDVNFPNKASKLEFLEKFRENNKAISDKYDLDLINKWYER